MEPTLPESLLSEFGEFVERRIGLHLPLGRLVDLERGLRAAALEMGWTDTEAFTRHLLEATPCQELQDMLAAHLTIGETYFYRDPRAFEVFEKEVLPELIKQKAGREKRLRIWSAACCTGEEPYSIAMAVRRVLGEDSGWKVSILATDLNPRFLQKAAQGIYGPWSFRVLPQGMREEHFHEHATNRWRIDDRIKRDVTFAGLNFLEDSFPSVANGTQGVDVIFCRNVLMYFSRETAAKVIAKLRRCLTPDGWLFTSATDAPRDLFAGFETHAAEGTIIYRRCEEKPAEALTLAPKLLALPAPSGKKEKKGGPAEAAAEKPRKQEKVTQIEAASRNLPAGGGEEADLRHEARMLADKGRFDEALAKIDKAIEGDKLDVLAHYLRGVILHEQKREREAASALHRALYLDPGFVLAHVTLGNLMRRGGKERAARRCFDNAREILGRMDRDTVLPESGGMTAGRLLRMIPTTQEAAA